LELKIAILLLKFLVRKFTLREKLTDFLSVVGLSFLLAKLKAEELKKIK